MIEYKEPGPINNLPEKPKLNVPWLLRMAWRDTRRSRGKLVLFLSSIVLGIAALVAINSFRDSLQVAIDEQARSLIGADLVIGMNKEPDSLATALVDSVRGLGSRSDENRLLSMVYFVKSNATRLVQVRAMEGGFPYFGKIETVPEAASRSFRTGRRALVDYNLMLQYEAKTGDSVRVGNQTFVIEGALRRIPGQTAMTAAVAPVVYIPRQYLPETGLMQRGSRVSYYYYYDLADTVEPDTLGKKLEPRLEEYGMFYDTVQTRKESMGRSYDELARFLALVGFVALLLGCVGVASAVHVYMRDKLKTIGVLRCLGMSGKQAFLVYLFQVAGMGLIGGLIGAMIGSVVQLVLPELFKAFLPVNVEAYFSVSAALQGVLLGVFVSVLFALLPLLSIRQVSPLITLRANVEHLTNQKDPLRWAVYALILLFILLFSRWQLGTWWQAGYFTGGVVVAFLVLAGLAKLLSWAVRRFFPSNWGYVWRQGLANLYRPNNQTLLLMVSIGLGTALIGTLYMVQRTLLSEVSIAGSEHQPNLVLFDIQNVQREEIGTLTRNEGLPILYYDPIVTVRLEKINELTLTAVREDTTLEISPRVFTREYRITYRNHLTEAEKTMEGSWGENPNANSDLVPVSLEDRYAERMKVKIGDTLVFNVQGAPIATQVSHLRQVDWNRVQSNFLVVFPEGVLEQAPQFHVLMTRSDDEQQAARFQRKVVEQYPNISTIGLDLILQTLDEVVSQISFVIQFMALFSIFTGLLVLVGSVNVSKFQRVQESVLLRTLGANRKQIFAITALEYLLLGALAAFIGCLIAFGASWALAVFSFEVVFVPVVWPLFIIFVLVAALTLAVGLLNSRGILNRPPLEVLRREA
ncbi:ABC transporter permease [Pontibacter beigongshangensis]|uniref:ABC transporter permease n=1 Tax=Pontibacter beigongshangensis TaxID=2574733 RepID=UPI001F50AA01|nr:FtsX-like permease family protein [Pontibacter beigongshangensis]